MASRIPAIATIAAFTLGFSALGMPAASAADPVAIDIVSVNDFHGRLEASPTSVPPQAGAAVMAGMVNSYRAANPNTAFVGAGDFIGASTFTSFIQKDQPTIDVLNAMGMDASAIGNHELDQGVDDLRNRVIPAASWDYLAANLYLKGTTTPAFQEYSLEDYQGVTVGFIGAVTDELTSLVSPAGIASIDVGSPTEAVNRVADQLSDGNEANGEADVIVLLVHEGAAAPTLAAATDDSRFGTIVTGVNANVDAIISGHTHLAYDLDVPVPGVPDRTRPVYSSGQYGEKYSHLALSVDPDTGDILSISADVLPLTGFTPDPAVAQIVADAVAVAKVQGAVKVGDITADFNRAVTGAGADNRGGESTLGNFVADVQLWATQGNGAQIAFMNPGGLRTDLKYAPSAATPGDEPGKVTYQEAALVQPFANTLVTLDLTGAQIRAALEQQWQPAGSSRPILHLGVSENLKYSYDPTKAAGSRIGTVYIDGVAIADTDVFKAVVNSFLASGGDNFGAFALGTNKADTGKVDLQSMVDYFVANPVETPDYLQRAIGVSLSAPDADGYSTGDLVTLNLSSLLMSNDGPRAGSVVVSANGSELGTATIDPTVVDTTDEVGRATLDITIPATGPGTLVLTVTVPETGSTIDVPVTVTAQPVVNVAPPVITGSARVGKTLTASAGSWSWPDPTIAYQWSRNGEAIEGATAATYTLVGADAGAAITVTVTAHVDGYSDGVATSAAVTVAKVDSTVYGNLAKFAAPKGSTVSYSIVVHGKYDVVPTGEVTVLDGKKVIATVVLTEADNGRVTVEVPASSRGIHVITVQYAGDDQLKSSKGWPNVLLVY